MNLLGFRSLNRIYYSDSCPAGLGSYSNQGFMWCFRIPDNLLFCTSKNLLKFIISGRLSPENCALSMTDSTTAKGWMKNQSSARPGTIPSKHQLASMRQENMRKNFWTWRWRDIASGLQGRDIMLQMLSLESGKGLTKILPQFCTSSSQIRCRTVLRYYWYPGRSVAGWSHCCSNCPWASGYRRNTRWQSSSMAILDNILQVHWMHRPFHGLTHTKWANIHAWCICNGCQRMTILAGLPWGAGWRNSPGCRLTCGADLLGSRKTEPHKGLQQRT